MVIYRGMTQLKCCINPLTWRGLGVQKMQRKILYGEWVFHTDIIINFTNEDSLPPLLVTLIRVAAVFTIWEREMCRFEKKVLKNETICCLIFVFYGISN